MPWGYNIFPNAGRQISAAARGAKTPGQGAADWTAATMDSFNPIGGGSSSLARLLSPSLLDPFVEIETNEDFAGYTVHPEQYDSDKRPQSHVYWSSTEKPYAALAQFLNKISGGSEFKSGKVDVYPASIEHVVESFGGGAWRTFWRAIQSSEAVGENVLGGGENRVKLNDIPMLRVLVGEPSDYVPRDMFNDYEDEMQRLRRQIRVLRERGDNDQANSVQAEYSQFLNLWGYLRTVKKRISQLEDREAQNKAMKQFNRRAREALGR
jgi:hypothetical protein